jgi:hypothetical protein
MIFCFFLSAWEVVINSCVIKEVSYNSISYCYGFALFELFALMHYIAAKRALFKAFNLYNLTFTPYLKILVIDAL